MLLRYAVENYKSFKNQQVFSMVAGKQTKHFSHVYSLSNRRILKGSFIFGANASGKSNLFESISFAKNLILNGLQKTPLSNCHYRIDKEYLFKPGVFQFDILSNHHFYSYGFAISYDKAIVLEEWLYNCDSSEVKIFERSIENGKVVFSTDLKMSKKSQEIFEIFSKNVPDNKMLLSDISERKIIEEKDFESYKNVFSWINNLTVIFPSSEYIDKIGLCSDKDLEALLQNFDTGIQSINVGEEKPDESLNFLPKEKREDFIKHIDAQFNGNADDDDMGINAKIGKHYLKFKKRDNQLFVTELEMDHGNHADLFALGDESDGTQRLFDLFPVFRFKDEPCVFLIDELDRSFHTKLVENFILKFYRDTKGLPAQLIATVHDSNIMDLNLLRQDEIWFVQREKENFSSIYSLNRFKERFDKKVEKDYLLGRYGAIPCIRQTNIEGEDE